jgi:hypothetical protein
VGALCTSRRSSIDRLWNASDSLPGPSTLFEFSGAGSRPGYWTCGWRK